MKRVFVAAIAAILFAIPVAAKPLKIGVFIPGVREGSPTYSDLALGAEKFVAEVPGSTYKVFEAGFNQAEWEEKLTSFVATGGYDVILTSNPSLPDLIAKIAPLFPRQKFIALDGMKSGVPNLYTVLYNQVEQGYLAGYLAGLISSSSLPGAKPTKKAGMIIGQHYPVMDKLIAPGFEQGLKAADPGAQVDLRVLGNWYDATKASELARSMIEGGVDVILPIAGSASQGVIKASQDAGTYLVFFDSNEYSRAPKHILGCVALKQKELALAALMKAADGSLQYGKADIVGIRDGYIELLDKDPAYVAGLPSAIRSRMDNLVSQMKSGALALKVPAF